MRSQVHLRLLPALGVMLLGMVLIIYFVAIEGGWSPVTTPRAVAHYELVAAMKRAESQGQLAPGKFQPADPWDFTAQLTRWEIHQFRANHGDGPWSFFVGCFSGSSNYFNLVPGVLVFCAGFAWMMLQGRPRLPRGDAAALRMSPERLKRKHTRRRAMGPVRRFGLGWIKGVMFRRYETKMISKDD